MMLLAVTIAVALIVVVAVEADDAFVDAVCPREGDDIDVAAVHCSSPRIMSSALIE